MVRELCFPKKKKKTNPFLQEPSRCLIYPSENTSDKTQPHRRHRLQGKYPSQVCVPIVSQAPDGTLGFNSSSKTLEKPPLVLGREIPDSRRNFKGINPTAGQRIRIIIPAFFRDDKNQPGKQGWRCTRPQGSARAVPACFHGNSTKPAAASSARSCGASFQREPLPV